jgi:potassium/chloride transporter 4/5/6
MDHLVLRDKFGESLGGRLAMGLIAWPSEWLFLIGAVMTTVASAMHSMVGAPRLLQAIAKDETVPLLRPLVVTAANGEPRRALFLTYIICQVSVLIGNLDELNPLLSCFFLMCYGFINLACALQTLLKTPNWRPRFKYYHWATSVAGVALCVALMFMSSWLYALISMAIAGALYKYIEYNGAKKEWGDGVRGLALSAARFALLRVEEGEPHIKNWRPQILVFAKFDMQTLKPKYKQLMSFASQLKTGKGLIMPVTVLQGEYVDLVSTAKTVKQNMKEAMSMERLKGFSEVVVSDTTLAGLTGLLQTAGVGGLKPNTVIMGWPSGWRTKRSRREQTSWRIFVDMLRRIAASKMTVIVPKGLQFFPDSVDKLAGTLDVWWIVHDGGLLMLLPFLLQRHKTWQHCRLRIFTVARIEDNSVQMKEELRRFLYNARIDAEVEVVEMENTDITPYTYERTLIMEQRSQYLSELKLKRTESRTIIEEVMEPYRQHEPLRQHPDLPNNFFAGRRASSYPNDNQENVSTPMRSSVLTENHENVSQQSTPRSSSTDGNPSSPNRNASYKLKPTQENVLRMHTAVRLNEMIQSKSKDARLVVVNLPSPPKEPNIDSDANYLEFLEAMTEGLQKVMLVRGGGHEVITIYS